MSLTNIPDASSRKAVFDSATSYMNNPETIDEMEEQTRLAQIMLIETRIEEWTRVTDIMDGYATSSFLEFNTDMVGNTTVEAWQSTLDGKGYTTNYVGNIFSIALPGV